MVPSRKKIGGIMVPSILKIGGSMVPSRKKWAQYGSKHIEIGGSMVPSRKRWGQYGSKEKKLLVTYWQQKLSNDQCD